MKEKGARIQFIDAMKGIAIVWIVFYHLLAPSQVKNIIIPLMDNFLVSFFFLSGYFYRSGKRTVGENIRNRARSLMVPFFRYSLSFWVVGTIYLVVTQNETIQEAFLCLRNFFAGCIWNRVIQDWFSWEYYSLGKRYSYLADFWFLIAMLFSSILFFLLVDRVLHSRAATLITVAILFAITGICQHFAFVLPYNLQLTPYWTAFMLLGSLAGECRVYEVRPSGKGLQWGVAAGALAVGIVIAMLKTPSQNLFRGTFGENEVVSMLLCIAAAVPFIFGLGKLLALAENAGLRLNEISWLGSHSLIIYLFHMFYAWILSTITGFSLRYEEVVSPGVIAGSVVLALACLVLCIFRNMLEDWLVRRKAKA